MTSGSWDFTASEKELAAELADWLPQRVFDAHAHLYRRPDLGPSTGGVLAAGPQEAGTAAWGLRMEELLGRGRSCGGLFMGFPTAEADLDRCNAFTVSQAEASPDSRASLLVSPAMDPGRIAELAARPSVAGLKPYHVFSPKKPTFDAALDRWLPDWAWRLADRLELCITIHLVRDGALSDPENQRILLSNCRKYPRARVILAHAGRGFHAPNTVRGVQALRGLENVWFDCAAVCEAEPLVAVLDEFGPSRLLWGTDFPVCLQRGRCVTVGEGFVWVDRDTVRWDAVSPACTPIPVGIEGLRALRGACAVLGLNRKDVEAVFSGNARRLLGLEQRQPGLTQALYRHAKDRIPGGVQLLSKRPEQFAPDVWPAYFTEARGCRVRDMDGRYYYDMVQNSVGACLLGYRHPAVTAAVRRALSLGTIATQNPPDEVALADRLCELHPWAERVRLTRAGGETATVAVRIARATTDRSVILICGYSGWHDWYLAANLGDADALRGHLLPGLEPLGVPRELRGTTLAFHMNDRAELDAAIAKAGNRLAAVVMEPCRNNDPEPGFLAYVRDRVHAAGGLLVFDEVSIGWRRFYGGAHMRLGIEPDIAFFSKSLGNGHPIGAVIGTRPAMEGAVSSFISSTYWTEAVGPAAALATLEEMGHTDVPAYVDAIGKRTMGHWRKAAAETGLPVEVPDCYPCLAHFAFKHPQGEALRTLFTQLMLERGFLAGTGFYPTLAHDEAIVDRYGEAVGEVFSEMAKVLSSGDVERRLKGPVAHSGFRRLL